MIMNSQIILYLDYTSYKILIPVCIFICQFIFVRTCVILSVCYQIENKYFWNEITKKTAKLSIALKTCCFGFKKVMCFCIKRTPISCQSWSPNFWFFGVFFNPNLFNIIIPASVGKHFVKLMVKTSRLNVIRQHYFKYICYDNLVFDKYLNTSISFALKAMYWYLLFMTLTLFLILVKRSASEKCIFTLSGFHIEKILG